MKVVHGHTDIKITAPQTESLDFAKRLQKNVPHVIFEDLFDVQDGRDIIVVKISSSTQTGHC